VPPALAKPALVEVTGPTECFDPSGNSVDVIPCEDTGQDGDIQAGVPSAGYWSSTTGADLSDFAWVVGLRDGNAYAYGKGFTNLVWLVWIWNCRVPVVRPL
jgi:hypothetical protein